MQNLQKNLGLQKFSLNGTNRLVYEKPKNPDESELYPSKTSLTLAFTPYKQNE